MSFSYLSGCNPKPPAAPAEEAAWDIAGIWAKIENNQIGNANFFPNPYDKDAAGQADSIFGELDRYTWYKGIQYQLDLGAMTNANGTINFDEPDFILNTIRDLTRPTGQGKKVIFLLPLKTFNSSITPLLPPSLRQTGTAYAGGSTRYNEAIGYVTSTSGVATVGGYHLKLAKFRPGQSNALRTWYLDTFTQLYNRYKDHEAFGGIINTETTPLISADMLDDTEYNRDQLLAGRVQLLKDMKAISTKHCILEAVNFDVPYVTQMTGEDAPDGLLVNKLGFSNPNWHTGANLRAIYNAMDFLANQVVISNSCQGLDQDSESGQIQRTGAANDIYDFLPNPPNYGNPRTLKENPGYVGSTWTTHDPPNLAWIIARAQYLKTNILFYQNNRATTGNKNAPRYNWLDFSAAMNANTTIISPNTGGLIQNDPAGGMVITRPTYI